MKTLDKAAKGFSVAVAAVRVTSLFPTAVFFQLKATVTFFLVCINSSSPAYVQKGGEVSVVAHKLGSNSFMFFFANLLCHFFRVIRDAAHHGKLAYLVSEARLPHSGIVDNFDPLRLGLTVN